MIHVTVHFYSYFKELAGCARTNVTLANEATVQDLVENLCGEFPKWAPMQKCALVAVGVEYQGRDYVLKEGEEVSLFPPVQGG